MSPSTLSLVSDPAHDPVPEDVRAVIELFASQLAKVSFPDVSEVSLRREVDELRAEAKVVERARQALEAATSALEDRRRAIKASAARAIAYARIYSEAHPDRAPLATALATLTAPPVVTAPAKRRGRPRRAASEVRQSELEVVLGGV